MSKLKGNPWIWPKYLEQEFDGVNDRATVIIAASFLEGVLEMLLKVRLIERRSTSDLFEGYGPLSSFAAKTDIGFALGMMSQVEHTNLTLLRKMRNRFAHELDISSFSDPEIKKLCAQLEITHKSYSPSQYPIELSGPIDLTIPGEDSPRERFIAAFGYLQLSLATRWADARKQKRAVPEPLSVAEAMRRQLNEFDSLLVELNKQEDRLQQLDPSYEKGETHDSLTDSDPDLVSLVQVLRPFTEMLIIKLEEAYRS